MKPGLLDANVLLALTWPTHQHHAQAHRWFAAQAHRGWATCAFTQLAFIRLSSNPAYSTDAVSPREAATQLGEWTSLKSHHFWPSPGADDHGLYAQAIGHRQVNDAWLVAVARRNSGRLVTLDARQVTSTVPPLAVKKFSRFALFKTRIVENGTITYRKHWTIFFKEAMLPNILFILSLISISFVWIYFTVNDIDGRTFLTGALALVTIFFFLWWLYVYEDWRNDLYRVTQDLIIDRDKKPFGKESFRSAPIRNIQSLGHEVPNIIGLIFMVKFCIKDTRFYNYIVIFNIINFIFYYI